MATDFGIMPEALNRVIEARESRERAQGFFNDPVGWAKYMLDVDLWSKQREVVEALLHNKSTAVKAGHGVGKALSLDTPILTTAGWTTVARLRQGDYVFDEHGNPTLVLGKSEVFDMPLYEVEFSDGATMTTNAPHEWRTLNSKEAKKIRRKGRVTDWRDHWDAGSNKETSELRETLTYKNGSNASAANHIVPINGALNYPTTSLPIDPYVVGAWLGDGTSKRAEMTIGTDSEYIIEEFRKVGYSLTKTECGPCRYTFARQGFVQAGRGLNLIDNKHIPTDYQRASVEQRKELLRGLMDTDGFVAHGNICGIDLMNEELAQDVVELIRGLGVRASITPGRAYLNGRDVGTRYRIVFNPTFSPFTEGQYKDIAWHKGVGLTAGSVRTMRTVKAIREVGSGKSQCIMVDSPRHLFLAGKHLVPTHNSFLSAILVCWWVDTRYPDCKVATTAPSWSQVNTIIWDEVRKMKVAIDVRFNEGLIDHKLPGYITTQAEWKRDEDGLVVAMGRRPPESKEESAFQGLHGRVLAIGDEACGLTGELIDGLGNITSNESSRRLLIGNPTNPHSYFGKIFKDSDGSWKLLSISVLDSPNFTDEAKQMSAEALDKLSGPSYVEDKKVEYGEDSARYKARVLGEFAYDIEGDIFIKPEDVAKCYDTKIDLRTFEGAPVLGVDVSGTGEDSSIIYINHGGHVRFLDKQMGSQFSWETAQWVDRHAVNTGATQVRIDSNGIGEGVYSELCRLAAEHGRYIVIGMKGQSASPNKHQWRNARAYWWDNTRTEMRLGKIDLDPDDDILTDELVSVLYAYDDNTLGTGGLLIESKISMRKRGVKSPDHADAFMYACADLSDIVGSPLAGLRNGDTVMIEDEQPAWAVFGW